MPTMTINLRLPVKITKEKDVFVSACPTLDIASQGCTDVEAKENIKEAIELFITTCIEMGTISQVLRDCVFTKGGDVTENNASDTQEVNVILPYIAAQKNIECHA